MTSEINTKELAWTVVSCECDLLQEELCSWIFFQYESLGVESKSVENDKILLLSSFARDNDKIKNIDKLRQHFIEIGLSECAKTLKMMPLKDEDWLSNWKKHFEPFKIGDSFLICPPWATQTLTDKDLVNRKKIIIDPGMAFGTGLHATTSYCLKATEKHLIGPAILDVGTGSGILSIAVLLSMPETKITAIDFDENSFDNAKHNFDLNHLGSKIKLEQLTLEEFEKTNHIQFDTIFSNLTAEVIYDCLPIYNKILANGGNLILAGIIEERLRLIENAVSKYPFKLIDKSIESGWVGLVFNKESRCPT